MNRPRRTTRAAVLLLTAALAAAAWALPARPAAADDPVRMSPAEYDALLAQAAEHIHQAGAVPVFQTASELRAAADLVPDTVLVTTPGTDTLVDHRPLRDRVRRIASLAGDDRDEALRAVRTAFQARRDALAQLAAGGPQPPLDMAAEQQRLTGILRPAPPNPLRQLNDRLAEWLAQYFGRMGIRPGTASGSSRLIEVVLGIAGAGVVAWAAVFVVRQFRRRRRERVTGHDGASPIRGRFLGPDAQAEDYWREAARLASGGDFRPALRALYLAVLLHLDRSGRIRYRPAGTNGAYLRELAGAPDLFPPVRELTRLFESRWYGCLPAGPADFAAAAGLAVRAWKLAGGHSLPQEVMPGGPSAG